MSSNCSARTPTSTPSWAKKKPTSSRAGTSTSGCSMGMPIRIAAAVKVSVATASPRRKSPREKPTSSASGEAGDDEDDVVDPVQFVDPRAERGAEHRDVEEGLEQGRAHRLALDLQEAADLAPHQREEADLRRGHAASPPMWARDSSLRPTSARYASSRRATP